MWNGSFPFISLITGLILTELQQATELLCLPTCSGSSTLPVCVCMCVCVRAGTPVSVHVIG